MEKAIGSQPSVRIGQETEQMEDVKTKFVKSIVIDTEDTNKTNQSKRRKSEIVTQLEETPEKMKAEKEIGVDTQKKKEVAKKKEVPKPKEVVQEDFTSFAKRLKKTEIVKRPIEKAELEVVELVHHAFEAAPQNPSEEMITAAVIQSKPLQEIPDVVDDDDDNTLMKKKKKKITKITRSPKEEDSLEEKIPKTIQVVQEPIEEVKTIKDLKPTVKKPLKPVEVKSEDLSNKPGTFAAVKLKKAETVKRVIEKVGMEKVQLVHHEFENIPQDPAPDQTSSVIITSLGTLKEEDTENNNKKQVKKVKKLVKKAKPKTEVKSVPGSDDESIRSSVKASSPAVSDITVDTDKESSAAELSDFNKDKLVLKSEEKPISVTEKPKEVSQKPEAKKKPIPQPKPTEPEPMMPKLKKTAPRKPKEPSPEREKVQLKHHEFEPKPLDIPKEEKSSVRLTETENSLLQSKKVKKTKPKGKTEVDTKLIKEITPLIPQSDEEDGLEEEVSRKPRDPIAVPAAAIKKDHTDIEKVELPTFLNYPSEQGIIINKDQSPQVLLDAPEFPKESADIVLEEEVATEKAEATKLDIKTGKVKKKKKAPEEFRQIPIKVLKSDVTIETVTESEVVFDFVCVINKCRVEDPE